MQDVLALSCSKYTLGLAKHMAKLVESAAEDVDGGTFAHCALGLSVLKKVTGEEDFTGILFSDELVQLAEKNKTQRLEFADKLMSGMQALSTLPTVPFGNIKFGEINGSVHDFALFLKELEF